MRPVIKGNAPATYPPRTTYTFIGENAAAIAKLLGRADANNVPIGVCQNLILAAVKGENPPNGGTPAEFDRAVKAIRSNIADDYKTASVPLMTMLGAFCSYCESPLTGLLEVEHRASKSLYPTYSTAWPNFLLACSPCNNAKGNNPARAVVQGWFNPPKPAAPESDYYDAISAHYDWPDLNQPTFEDMPLVLEQETSADNWQALPMITAANLNNSVVSVDYTTRIVRAQLAGQLNPLPVRVMVTAANGSRSNQSGAMIDLYKPNQTGNAASTYDRRMINRTLAWFTCLNAMKIVAQMPEGQQGTAFKVIELLGVASGFYSVWLTILRYDAEQNYRAFIQNTNAPLLYAGTNVAQLPVE